VRGLARSQMSNTTIIAQSETSATKPVWIESRNHERGLALGASALSYEQGSQDPVEDEITAPTTGGIIGAVGTERHLDVTWPRS
jgi:hypothetical protein